MVSSAGTLENRPVNRINFDHHTWLSRVERDASEEIDEKDVAYVAGIIDGEGSLGIKKDLSSIRMGYSKSPLRHERVQEKTASESVLRFIHRLFHGSLYRRRRTQARVASRRTSQCGVSFCPMHVRASSWNWFCLTCA